MFVCLAFLGNWLTWFFRIWATFIPENRMEDGTERYYSHEIISIICSVLNVCQKIMFICLKWFKKQIHPHTPTGWELYGTIEHGQVLRATGGLDAWPRSGDPRGKLLISSIRIVQSGGCSLQRRSYPPRSHFASNRRRRRTRHKTKQCNVKTFLSVAEFALSSQKVGPSRVNFSRPVMQCAEENL